MPALLLKQPTRGFDFFLDVGNRLAMLADELYLAMLEVGHAARRHKIPGPLAHTMIDIAQVARALAAR